MTDAIKLMGLGCVTVALVCAFILVPDQPAIWGTLIGLYGVIFGVPIAVNKIRKKLGFPGLPEGMELTWAEIHMFEIGLGDSLSQRKIDLKEFEDYHPNYIKELLGEIHYYQMGFFTPRAVIVGAIISLFIKFLG